MRYLLLSIALATGALSACGQSGDDVLRQIEQQEKERAAWRAKIAADGPAWVAEHARAQGAITTPSGLVYRIVTPAPNRALPTPPAGSEVDVHYEGRLSDGKVFDSSFERGESAQFPLQNVIPGFREALMLMRPGEEVIAYLPSDIAYGSPGYSDIPPNAALQFRIVLLAYRTPDGRIVEAPASGAQP